MSDDAPPAETGGQPEHDRMRAVQAQTQPAGEFLEWLSTQGIVLGEHGEDGQLYQVYYSIEELLARWQGIDLDKIATEKRALLAAARATLGQH